MFPLTGELDSLGMRAADGREVCGLELLFFQNLLHKNHSEAIALSQLEEPIRAGNTFESRFGPHPRAAGRRRARLAGARGC